MKSLKARIRLLTLTTVVALVAAIVPLVLGFARPEPTRLGEVEVERLSVLGEDARPVVELQYTDSGKTRRAGLQIWDRPTDLAAAADSIPRVFVGSQDRVAQIRLLDTRGRVRARLVVDAQDVPRLEFLDESGAVIDRYPREAR